MTKIKLEDLFENKLRKMPVYVSTLEVIPNKKLEIHSKSITITKNNTTKYRPQLFYKEMFIHNL